MAEITVSADTSKVATFLDAFPRETSKAAFRALRRGTKAAGTQANRLVSRDMGLKVGTVRKLIRITEPTGTKLEGALRGSLKRIPLIEFNAKGPEPSRGRGRGVSYRIGRGGRKVARSAFISRTPTGHRGVFQRRRSKRLPIAQLFGPSIGRVLDQHRGAVVQRGQEQFEKELDRLLDRIISSFGGRLA